MNINHKLCTKIALVLLGFSPILWNTNSAHAVTGTLNLDNEDFFVDDAPGLNNASGNSTINTTATPEGFGSHFDSTDGNTFLLLGGNNAGVTIPSTGSNGNSSAFSSTFEIDSDSIARNNLVLTFDWAFQGDAAAVGNDSFEIFLSDSDFNLPDPISIFRQETYGQDYSTTASIDLSGLAPDDYVIYATFNERISNGNSAAGFDNVAVGVPFEFSPSLGLLMIGGLFGGHAYLKRRKLAAKINLD